MMRAVRTALVGVSFALAWPAQVRAESSASTCFSAAEEGQVLRKRAQLVEARASFRVCAQPECPLEARQLCEQWITEVDASTPSIVLRAMDSANRDITDLRVWVDGTLLLDRLDGTARRVNPGTHHLRYTGGPGSTPKTEDLVIAEGEKDRLIVLHVTSDTKAEVARGGATPPEPSRVLPYALLGASAVGFGVFTYLTIWGQNRFDDWVARGRPEADVASLQTQRAVAFSVLGAGAILAGVGAWILVASHPRASNLRPASVGVTPLYGGAVLTLKRAF
jgi:hypothetical protein